MAYLEGPHPLAILLLGGRSQDRLAVQGDQNKAKTIVRDFSIGASNRNREEILHSNVVKRLGVPFCARAVSVDQYHPVVECVIPGL